MSDRPIVTVVGSVHTDLIAAAGAMPTPGSSVLGARFTLAPGGKAGNQAAQLAKLGIPTALVSRIGTDSLGDFIATQLASTGIDLSHLARSDQDATGASTVFAVGGEYASIIVPGASTGLTEDHLRVAEVAFRRSTFALTQLELGPELACATLSRAQAVGAITVLNASPIRGIDPDALSSVLDVTGVLVVNRHETAVLLGSPVAGRTEASRAAVRLNERHNLDATIVTCGADGVVLARGSTVVEQDALRVDVVDTVGAGDAFLGALIAAWHRGNDDQAALRYGTAAGALAVSGSGAFSSLPNREDIDRFLRSQD